MFKSVFGAKKQADDDLAALKKPVAPIAVAQEQAAPSVPFVDSKSLSVIADGDISIGAFKQQDFVSLPRMGWQGMGQENKLGATKSSEKFVGSPLTLVELHVKVQVNVTSFYSKTTSIMTFYNETDKVLEGELVFPLPEKSTVCGFGLDVDGELCDAVPVEKEVARVVFETEVRSQKDPGLIEHVSGNLFKTRVYPMPPKGTRTIKVVHVSELQQNEKFDSLAFYPFDSDQQKRASLKNFTFASEVLVPKSSSSDSVVPTFYTVSKSGQAKQLAKLIESAEQPGLYSFAIASRAASQPNDPLTSAQGLLVLVPHQLSQVQQVASVESDKKGNRFFAVQDFVDHASSKNTVANAAASAATSVGIIWDASFSRFSVEKSNEFSLIEQVFKNLLANNSHAITVFVSLFHYTMEDPVKFSIDKPAALDALLNFLKDVKYDGGSALSSVPLFFSKIAQNVDFCLLFSDGLSSVGPEKIPVEGIKAPIYSFGSGVTLNAPLLSFISQKSGAQYHSLMNKSAQQVTQMASMIGVQSFSFLYATCTVLQTGEQVDDILVDIVPSKPTPVSGRFVLAGRINPDFVNTPCKITLCYGTGSTVTRKVEYTINANNTVPKGEVLNIFWASRMIEELSAFPDLNKDLLKHIGLEYGLVTPGTSLLVLENLEQHLKYNIAPAESRTKLRAQYDAAQKEKTEADQRVIQSKLDSLYHKWQSIVAWYNTDFSSRNRQVSNYYAENDGLLNSVSCSRSEMLCCADECECAEECCKMDDDNDAFAPPPPPPAMECCAGAPPPPPAASAAPPKPAAAPSGGNAPSIKIKSWDPDVKYVKLMKACGNDREKIYQVYYDQRQEYVESPSFFFDCADFLFKQGFSADALRVLTNIAEIQVENGQLLRIMGYKLHVEKQLQLAKYAFERVMKLRPEEPQSYRDYALVLDDLKEYGPAMKYLWKVVTGTWDWRFDEIELTALIELNRIIHIIKRENQADLIKQIPTKDERFLVPFELDLRVALAWDLDMTDIDLHVLDPWNEDGYYGNKQTYMGGLLSRDFTGGYGPEHFMLKQARKGAFKVKTHYYASHQQSLSGGCTLLLTFYTNYAKPNEEKQMVALRLTENRESFVVAEIEWK